MTGTAKERNSKRLNREKDRIRETEKEKESGFKSIPI
jgi:hypothetical protein